MRALGTLLAACLLAQCLADTITVTTISGGNTLQIASPSLTVLVNLQGTFGMQILYAGSNDVLLQTAGYGTDGAQPVMTSRWEGIYEPLYLGYLFREGVSIDQEYATSVEEWHADSTSVMLSLKTKGTFMSHAMDISFSNFTGRQFGMALNYNDTDFDVMPYHFAFPQLSLAFDTPSSEAFYGFGQRWQGNSQRGELLHCWTEDGAWAMLLKWNDTTTDFPVANATYLPSPFFLSSQGYGFQVVTGYRTSFDMAHSDESAWAVNVETSSMQTIFYMGETPAESLYMFTVRRGLTLVPPPFEFAPWKQMGSVIPGWSDLQVAEKMIADDIPFSLVQGYVHYMPDGGQGNNTQPLIEANEAFHGLGIKSTCYFNPMMDTKFEPYYSELDSKGYFCKNMKNESYQFLYMTFYVSQLDFTNPDAVTWFQDYMATAIDVGFDGWMYDFGEYTPIDSVFQDGSLGVALHNYYPTMYQSAVYGLFTRPQYWNATNNIYAPPFVAFVRSGYTDTGNYVWAHWTGDASVDFGTGSGLPAQIDGCLTSGLTGVSFCGSDVGGYVCQLRPPNSPSIELLSRWVQFGAFAGIMRDETQGDDCKNRSQLYSSEMTFTNWRKFAKLRTAMFPYIYSAAHEARTLGLPIMRHHILSFPTDTTAHATKFQYMFGPDFLCAPVHVEGATWQFVYLPLGEEWYDVFSPIAWDVTDGRFRLGYSAAQSGGQTVRVTAELDAAPLFVRAGAIVATLDPTVDTVNEKTNMSNAVVTMGAMANISHVWVFPRANLSAEGSVWDGDAFTLDPTGSSEGCATLSVTAGPGNNGRAYVFQIPYSNGPTSVSGVPPVAAWDDLTPLEADQGYYFDPEQSVLWVRLNPGTSSVGVCF